jgi:hypothetical protein
VNRIGVLIAGVLATLVMAAPAQADPISFDYCEFSLRGGGTLAPDNDIKTFWDRYEANTGRNIVSSTRTATNPNEPQWVALQFAFLNAQGEVLTYKWFNCWRDGFLVTGQYHDDEAP